MAWVEVARRIPGADERPFLVWDDSELEMRETCATGPLAAAIRVYPSYHGTVNAVELKRDNAWHFHTLDGVCVTIGYHGDEDRQRRMATAMEYDTEVHRFLAISL